MKAVKMYLAVWGDWESVACSYHREVKCVNEEFFKNEQRGYEQNDIDRILSMQKDEVHHVEYGNHIVIMLGTKLVSETPKIENKMKSFEMFTPAGEKACNKLLDKVVDFINGEKRITKEQVATMLKEGIIKISKTHGEVRDSEPPLHFQEYVNKELAKVGYNFTVSKYVDF